MIEVIIALFSIMTFLIILYIFLGFYFGLCSPDERIQPSDNNLNNADNEFVAINIEEPSIKSEC
jgi:hypothetical protein